MTGRFVSPKPLPSPRQRELLVCLIEECAEIIHRATKALRFGLAEVQSGQRFSNAERLAWECGDLLGVLDALREAGGVLNDDIVAKGRDAKPTKLNFYLQSQAEPKL